MPTAQVQCPCCWETIELEVDVSAGSSTYTEDCSVCCQPLTVRLAVADDAEHFTVGVTAENA